MSLVVRLITHSSLSFMYSYDNLSGLIPTAITGGLVQTVLTHPIVNTLVLPSLLMLVTLLQV